MLEGLCLDKDQVKNSLEDMCKATGMKQNTLINIAVATMVAKYQVEGMRIFFEQIIPPRKVLKHEIVA